MILIPFGNGVVAAFIFLVFEILVFPLLFYVTSKIASLLLYWSALKGIVVLVDSMKFPLWSEGLTRHQLSHVPLLAVRVILLAIPVYLETTLSSRDVPQMVSRTVENAFIPEPADDWFSYQNRSGEDIDPLRHVGERIFFSCTSMDEEGWVWARVANITYLPNDRLRIRCVSDTEKAVYRLTEKVVNVGSENARDFLAVRISWTEGRVKDFPQPLVVQKNLWEEPHPNETAYRIHSVRALNDSAMQCFFEDSVKTSSVFGTKASGEELRGWCQKEEKTKEETKGVAFYVLKLDMAQLEDGSVTGTCGGSCKLSTRNRSIVAVIEYRGSFEFKDKVLLGAKHMANMQPKWTSTARAMDIARFVLYSKMTNVTVNIRSGNVKAMTEVEAKAIITGAFEVVFVLVCALVLACEWRRKWRHVQQPNTVNGLSKCWAEAEENWGGVGSKWISLSLPTSGSEGDSLPGFEPCRTKRESASQTRNGS